MVSLQISMCNLLICVVLPQLMQDEYGATALFTACSQGWYDPAALLIEHGADVNYLSKVRPLHVHGQHGKMVCSVLSEVELLYIHGHSVWVIDACRLN